jgi:hypothetical protein
MVEITYQMVLSTIQTVGILVGIFYYIIIMRSQQRKQQQQLETRQAQLFMQLMDKYTSKEGIENMRVLGSATWSSYEEWLELRRDNEYLDAYLWQANIYDGIGALLRTGLLNVRNVALVAAVQIVRDWGKYKDVIYELRKRENNRLYRSMWEYLNNMIMKYWEEHPELAP